MAQNQKESSEIEKSALEEKLNSLTIEYKDLELKNNNLLNENNTLKSEIDAIESSIEGKSQDYLVIQNKFYDLKVKFEEQEHTISVLKSVIVFN